MRVHVYWNLHKKKFSVRHKGKVIDHVDRLFLCDVEFRVSQKGRQRVLREKVKNVHAYVCGTICDAVEGCETRAYYNPYKTKYFEVDGQEIHDANFTRLEDGRVYVDCTKKERAL